MPYHHTVGATRYTFEDLKHVLAAASPLRSGDVLAGVSARNASERVAAQSALADIPLKHFLSEALIPYESDDVTRLILDRHDPKAFVPVAHLTVGDFRDWLLGDGVDGATLSALSLGLIPEMVAAVSKLMRLQDLVLVAAKCEVVSRFRNTLGLRGRMSTRLQPNHPTDDLQGVAASILDGLFLGAGDAVIGINPVSDSLERFMELTVLLDRVRSQLDIPTQCCVLGHVTTALAAMERRAPVDLVFQSIGGTEGTNRGFGITLSMLTEAQQAATALGRGAIGNQVMYFETGQGSALSANAAFGVDQQTLEARAYGVARVFRPLLVNSVVGFIGPEYLADGKQITRAGLEDHFCAKLLGLPMGCDVCYTVHADADQDDVDTLLTLLGVAGCNYVMGIPGSDDVMLSYQSTSFHDALYIRRVLAKLPSPEFLQWQQRVGLVDGDGALLAGDLPPSFPPLLGLK